MAGEREEEHWVLQQGLDNVFAISTNSIAGKFCSIVEACEFIVL